MQVGFHALPLQLDLIPRMGQLPLCSARQSIAQHIHLIITTALGELAVNDAFGCGLWDGDFDNLTSRSRLKDAWILALGEAIKNNEPRLSNIRCELQIHQEELNASESFKRIKNRLDIIVSALIAGTNEPVVFKDHFFISPLSYN